jgi:chromosome segregation ATPase
MGDASYEDVRELVRELTEISTQGDEEVLKAAVDHLDLSSLRQEVEALRCQAAESSAEMQGAAAKVLRKLDDLLGEVEDVRSDARSVARAAVSAGDRIPGVLKALDNEAIGDAAASKVADRVRPSLEEMMRQVDERAGEMGRLAADIERQLTKAEKGNLAMVATLDAVTGGQATVRQHVDAMGQRVLEDMTRYERAMPELVESRLRPLDERLGSLEANNAALLKKFSMLFRLAVGGTAMGVVTVGVGIAVLLILIQA